MKYQTKFWNNYFNYYDVLLELIPYRELMNSLSNSLAIDKRSKVLDLGSGTGNIQYFVDHKTDITSFDNSIEAMGKLKSKFPHAKTHRGSILDEFPFENNTFDRIILNNVLYTINRDNWEHVITEIRRVTTKDAIIVISNLNEGFNALDIYKDHFNKSLHQIGILNTIKAMGKLIYPTIQMFRYNKIISKNNTEGNYSFIRKEEQKEVFEKYGFTSLHNTKLVYSGQAVLNSFSI